MHSSGLPLALSTSLLISFLNRASVYLSRISRGTKGSLTQTGNVVGRSKLLVQLSSYCSRKVYITVDYANPCAAVYSTLRVGIAQNPTDFSPYRGKCFPAPNAREKKRQLNLGRKIPKFLNHRVGPTILVLFTYKPINQPPFPSQKSFSFWSKEIFWRSI